MRGLENVGDGIKNDPELFAVGLELLNERATFPYHYNNVHVVGFADQNDGLPDVDIVMCEMGDPVGCGNAIHTTTLSAHTSILCTPRWPAFIDRVHDDAPVDYTVLDKVSVEGARIAASLLLMSFVREEEIIVTRAIWDRIIWHKFEQNVLYVRPEEKPQLWSLNDEELEALNSALASSGTMPIYFGDLDNL